MDAPGSDEILKMIDEARGEIDRGDFGPILSLVIAIEGRRDAGWFAWDHPDSITHGAVVELVKGLTIARMEHRVDAARAEAGAVREAEAP